MRKFRFPVELCVLAALIALVALMPSGRKGEAAKDEFYFNRDPKTGYAIWGIQPGQYVQKILQNLPSSARTEFANQQPKGRTIVLYGPRARVLKLTTLGSSAEEIVERVRVDPVPNSMILEFSGKPVLHGAIISSSEIKHALGPDLKYITDGFESVKDEYRVQLGCATTSSLTTIELTHIDTAPREHNILNHKGTLP